MSREKQIEEMAHFICERDSEELCTLDRKRCDLKCTSGDIAKHLHNKGYRKIYDDHQRQCTCYALGCQMAEQLKREVAAKIFAEIERIIDKYYNRHIFGVEDLSDVEQEAVMNFSDDITGDLAELKKKYTEVANDTQ